MADAPANPLQSATFDELVKELAARCEHLFLSADNRAGKHVFEWLGQPQQVFGMVEIDKAFALRETLPQLTLDDVT
jgi:hypothetical protein